MKVKTYTLFTVLVLFAVSQSWAESADNREYQVKAAFLYNFLMFVNWPAEKMADGNEPIIIGIIGKDPFEDTFEPIKDRQVKGKKVVIKRFNGLEELKKAGGTELNQTIEAIRKCHLLFICRSEKKTIKEIINLVKDYDVLTVGEMQDFLEPGGGIINFVVEEDRVRFEINLSAAKGAKLQIRSQLLRLAEKVIEDKTAEGAEN